jgi:integrase
VEPRAERRVPTLGQLIDEFIEYQKPRVKAADAECCITHVRRLLTCLPADTPIDQIAPGDADKVYQEFKASWRSQRQTSTCCNSAVYFQLRLRAGVHRQKPIQAHSRVAGYRRQQAKAIHPDKQVRQLLDKIPDPELQLVIVLARWCGLRIPSEIRELRWRDVLWDKNRIIVRSPKTEHHAGKGIRTPKLFPIVRRYLKALRRLRPDAKPDDYVFRYCEYETMCIGWCIAYCRKSGHKTLAKTFSPTFGQAALPTWRSDTQATFARPGSVILSEWPIRTTGW